MSHKALILCVDDEPVNLTILEELLQDNYDLSVAKSGEGCLQQVSLQEPDLILLDVNMPDMDGLETCARLKSDPSTAEIPIIFVSALASQEELMAGYEAGGDDYITKPFSEDILQKKIEIVLASQLRKQELKSISDQAVEALRDNLSTTEELGDRTRISLHGGREDLRVTVMHVVTTDNAGIQRSRLNGTWATRSDPVVLAHLD